MIDVETRSPVETYSNAGDEKVSPDAAPQKETPHHHHHSHATCAQGDEIDLADIINVITVIVIRTATLLQAILAF